MTVFGLPLHPLIVHATVVILPLSAAMVILSVFSRRFRGWAGPVPMLLAVVGTILVPITTSAGEDLEHALPANRLIETHAERGDTLIWFALPFAILVVLAWLLTRFGADNPTWTRGALIVLAVAAVVGAAASVDLVLIGHSGAEAAWSGVMQNK